MFFFCFFFLSCNSSNMRCCNEPKRALIFKARSPPCTLLFIFLRSSFFIHLHETTLWRYFLSTENRTIDNRHNWTCLSCWRLQRQLFSWSCSLVIWTSETKWKIFHCMSHGKFSYKVKVNVFNCENFMVGNLRTAPDNGIFMWAMWIYLT